MDNKQSETQQSDQQVLEELELQNMAKVTGLPESLLRVITW